MRSTHRWQFWWNLRNFAEGLSRARTRANGRVVSRATFRAFSGPHQKHGENVALFVFTRANTREEGNIWGTET